MCACVHDCGHVLGAGGGSDLHGAREEGKYFLNSTKKPANLSNNGHFFLCMFLDFLPFSVVAANTNK